MKIDMLDEIREKLRDIENLANDMNQAADTWEVMDSQSVVAKARVLVELDDVQLRLVNLADRLDGTPPDCGICLKCPDCRRRLYEIERASFDAEALS